MSFSDSAIREKAMGPLGPAMSALGVRPSDMMMRATTVSPRNVQEWLGLGPRSEESLSGFGIEMMSISPVDTIDLYVGTQQAPHQIQAAQSIDDLTAAAQAAGLDDAAEQLEELVADLRDDPDAPEIDPDSLRLALLFLNEHRTLPGPNVGVRRSGFASLSWHVPPDGVLTVFFDNSGAMTFATNTPGEDIDDRQRMSGTTTNRRVVACVFGNLLNAGGAK